MWVQVRDGHKNGSNVLVGVGRVTYILAQMWENEALKAPQIFFFWPAEGGNFFLPHVSVLKMLRFLWRNQIWVKSTKKNFP